MNLNLNTWRLKSLLTKLMIYLMALYCLLIVASLVITNYLVINMQEYKSRIEQSIYAKTGYNLHLGNIQTKLNYYYLPEVIIDNLILTNPKDKKHNLQIKQIDLVLSYRSIWELQPIFKQISINGTNLIIERFADGHIVLNGLPLYTPQQISLDKVRSPFDWQKWLLKQGDINLEHIDISYQDYKDNLSPITIYNIQLSIHNNWRNYHQIALAIYGKSQSKMLYANLNWHGGNFANFTQWKDAEFQVGSINYNLSNWLVSVEHLLPQLANLNSPSFNPVISAKLNQGNLEYLQSNFDLQNFKLALADIDVINLPKLGGNLAIKLVQPKYYSIKASNLTVTTKSGALFDHAVINGEYTQGKSGKVVLSNTNLVALNNLLNFFDATSGLSLQGTLSNIDYSWQGFFTKPKDFNISAQFKDIGLVSSNPKYPNLSHVSGGFIIGKNRGELNLSLNDSVFRDDSLFLIPYEFKNLTTKLDWQTQNQQFKLTIHPTSLETKDFKGNLSGSYTRLLSNPNDSGYLSMQAHVDRVKTAKVGDYLPKSIPLSVHQWLNIALIGGDAVNANMTFAGALANFPFQDGKGLFYITSDIDNATLRYVKDWPVLNQIYGQFILKNTTITINAKKAKINNNYLDPTSVVIPDYASTTGVYLVANGYAHGSTANFMHYLAQTPINNLIGKLPEKIQTNGNGKVKIWLKVPFSDPLHTQVNGSYTFLDNQLKFDLPIPQLSRVNGILNFSHHGINISNLTLSAFDSKLNLSAEQTTDGKIKFLVNSPQLNYGEVSKFYLPSLANIVEGKSSTNVNFIIGKHGIDNLQAQSKLIGVTVNLPKPFTKSSESSSNFELQLFTQKSHAIEINWQYSNLLYGKQIFPEHGRATHGQIMTTKSTKLNDNELEALTTIKLNLPQVNILEWIKQVSSMLSSTRKIELSNKTATKQISKPRQFFPLLIQLNSNFSLGNVDLGVGNINVIADQHSSYFNLYTPVTNGQGEFNYMNNQLSLDLTDYSILIKHSNHINSLSESKQITTNKITKFPNINLNIHNLWYQNHNLGSLTTRLFLESDNLQIESGNLIDLEHKINFSGTSFCLSCNKESANVVLKINAEINNLGHLLEELDLGKIIDHGRGEAKSELSWQGGLADFNLLHIHGLIEGHFSSGKFLKVNPGILGGLMSIINLQGLFELSFGDINDIFKTGFFFTDLDFKTEVNYSEVILKHLYLSGPMAVVTSNGKANFADNSLDAYLSVSPKLGIAVALTAGVATLNPFIGLAVYLGELASGQMQNKLFAFGYHVAGNLKHPQVTKVEVSKQFIRNIHNLVGSEK